ncbi:MAG: hypothetical protein WC683_17785 [bacterium]
MKTLLRIKEMIDYLPGPVKDAVHHVAKESGQKTDDMELHRHTHSEKAKVNEIDPACRKSLAYVSHRSQDRDDEIVIPKALKLDEFKKYGSVLVNHNYSLLPVGSDEWIEADDYGIKALTVHADTGPGTLANVVWDLTRQGHLKGRSVGFVPTSFTKPGARDWDHVANNLQSDWKEFDKSRAEKSISRIITGGVLLEHSFVSVPCNVDAEMIGVVKAMNLGGRVIKQLGWRVDEKSGLLITKQAEPEKCVCDECGLVRTCEPGTKCTEENCFGTMKPKKAEEAKADQRIEITSKQAEPAGPRTDAQRAQAHFKLGEEDWNALSDEEKEAYIAKLPPRGSAGIPEETKAVRRIEIISKGGPGSGNFGHAGRPGEIGGSGPGGGDNSPSKDATRASRMTDSFMRGKLLREHGNLTVMQGRTHGVTEEEREAEKKLHAEAASLHRSAAADYRSRGVAAHASSHERDAEMHEKYAASKGFQDPAATKENPSMPGHSFTACVAFMEDKGYDTEAAQRICGKLQAESGEKALPEPEADALYEFMAVEKEGDPSGFLVKEDDGTTHLPTKRDGKLDHGMMGAAWAALHGGYRGNKYEGPKKQEAISRLKKLYEDENLPLPSEKGAGEPAVVTVVRPAPAVKVLYAPPDPVLVAKGVSAAVERALARRTGKIL